MTATTTPSTRGARQVPARRGRMARKENRAAYSFLSPWLIGLVVFWLGPIVASVLLSFTDWSLAGEASWVGTENYREMVGDYNFGTAGSIFAVGRSDG